MIRNEEIKDVTGKLLYLAIYNYLKTYSLVKEKHIVVSRFFPEQKTVSSCIHSLETTLGTSLWEQLAQDLSKKNNDFTIYEGSDKLDICPENMPPKFQQLINKTIKERINGKGKISLDGLKNGLDKEEISNDIKFKKMPSGDGCDLLLKKEEKIYIFDIKTVQPNSKNGNSFDKNIIEWTANLKLKHDIPAKNIIAKFIFPYSPINELNDESWWNEYRSRIKPLQRADVYIGNEFWEFLTGNEQAIEMIIEAIEEIGRDKKFMDLVKRSFGILSKEEANQFKVEASLNQIESLNIPVKKLEPEKFIEKGRKGIGGWSHINSKEEECKFNAFINGIIEKFLGSQQFNCPKCEEKIF